MINHLLNMFYSLIEAFITYYRGNLDELKKIMAYLGIRSIELILICLNYIQFFLIFVYETILLIA